MDIGVSGKVQGGREDVDAGTIYWDDIHRLAQMNQGYNNINRYGPFGGWEYTPAEMELDNKGRPTGNVLSPASQRFVATDPGMQSAMDRMSRRLGGEGFDAYEPPGQISSITDALMASRMEKMGLLDENSRPNLAQENYGPRFGHRQGGGWQNARNGAIYELPPEMQRAGMPPGGQNQAPQPPVAQPQPQPPGQQPPMGPVKKPWTKYPYRRIE